MARKPLDQEAPQRSYAGLFAVAVVALLAATAWALWDENVGRRPWKQYQARFAALERDRGPREDSAEVESDTSPGAGTIRQIVLPDFERNDFNVLVARVDRCTSCHVAIDKPGFEAPAFGAQNPPQAPTPIPNPYRTHPRRDVLLAKHPPERFGCTPCHHGQGPALNSPAEAHGEVAHWNQPLLRGARVQAACRNCHANLAGLAGAEVAARGQALFEELGCHGCHFVEDLEQHGKPGPSLRRVAAKLDPAWLVRWLRRPRDFRPRTAMPDFLLPEDEAEAIAAYLLDAGRAANDAPPDFAALPEEVDPRDAALVRKGKEIASSVGCQACHGFTANEVAASLGADTDVAPNLSRIAEKTAPAWLYAWLRNSKSLSPATRMPSLRLGDFDARAVTSYLATLGTPQLDPTLAARLQQPAAIRRGESLVRNYGCFGCHDIPGTENESKVGAELTQFGSKPVEELHFGRRTDVPRTWDDWTAVKLKSPRTYETERIRLAMPEFRLADGDVEALVVFLAGLTERRYPERLHADRGPFSAAKLAGRRLVNRYHCTVCHVIEGRGGSVRARYPRTTRMAPPNLNGEGAKVQGPWLFSFLKRPLPVRHWLKIRMPTYDLDDDEAATLVRYFKALDGMDDSVVQVDVAEIPRQDIAAARKLASVAHFACFACHRQGPAQSDAPPPPGGRGWEWWYGSRSPAPNLGMARERLNPDWIVRWLRDPQKFEPGTIMPSFYSTTPDGKTTGGPADILGGDSERQLRALRDLLMTTSWSHEELARSGG